MYFHEEVNESKSIYEEAVIFYNEDLPCSYNRVECEFLELKPGRKVLDKPPGLSSCVKC